MKFHPPLHNIIISRTDSIGDVVLTLPLAEALKKQFPGIVIAFLGRAYTRPVIHACRYVDEFIDVQDFLHKTVLIRGRKPAGIVHVFPNVKVAARAKDLKIPLRIGTTNRFFHWLHCNRMVKLSRRNSSLHEAQLNMKLLEALGIKEDISLQQLGHMFGLQNLEQLDSSMAGLIDRDKYNLVLHPKSQGSAREWGLDNFAALVQLLDGDVFNVFVSGTEKERLLLQPLFDKAGHRVRDITGTMSLGQFIAFISKCNGLVANSTGPLHIAAALGKDALGIYPPMRPIHPGRWAPLGPGAKVFVLEKSCSDCRAAATPCHCITEVQPQWIAAELSRRAQKIKPVSSV